MCHHCACIWIFLLKYFCKSLILKYLPLKVICINIPNRKAIRINQQIEQGKANWNLLVTESPWKVMKNVFYFTFKALFVLKIFQFLSCLFCLIRKIRLIFKFMTSQPWKQIIVIHMLSIILRTEGNQTMKFG